MNMGREECITFVKELNEKYNVEGKISTKEVQEALLLLF